MQRNRPLTQRYDRYTKTDFIVWDTLYRRQMVLLNKYACKVYIDAIKAIGFCNDVIPDFYKINRVLKSFTGWQLIVVPGLVPQQEFFELLSRKIFPATCWLRTPAEMDYIEEPDMFHDVFGHVPLLLNSDYAMFMQAFGALALEWVNNPALISLLSRVYWFTIEFGLIRENNGNAIYGAGILSSPGEALHAMDECVIKRSFNALDVINTAYRTDVIQEQYFIIESFAQLYQMLPEVNAIINNYRHDILSSNKQKTIL